MGYPIANGSNQTETKSAVAAQTKRFAMYFTQFIVLCTNN